MLVKTDKVLNLISKIDNRLTPYGDEDTKDETILK